MQTKKGESSLRRGRFWPYIARGDAPYTILDFTVSRHRDGPLSMLSGWSGFLQADACSGYDPVIHQSNGQIIERTVRALAIGRSNWMDLLTRTCVAGFDRAMTATNYRDVTSDLLRRTKHDTIMPANPVNNIDREDGSGTAAVVRFTTTLSRATFATSAAKVC